MVHCFLCVTSNQVRLSDLQRAPCKISHRPEFFSHQWRPSNCIVFLPLSQTVDNAKNNCKVKKQAFLEHSENHLFNKRMLPTCCTVLSWMFLRRSWQVRRFSTSLSRDCSTWSCTRSIPAQTEISYSFYQLQHLSETEPNLLELDYNSFVFFMM
jgi:hypothetical protein